MPRPSGRSRWCSSRRRCCSATPTRICSAARCRRHPRRSSILVSWQLPRPRCRSVSLKASRLRRKAGSSSGCWALFAASIGLPFVALAASAPLLQNWFAASGHPHAANPYLLYAASNLGSFAALMAYPFVVEPLLDAAHTDSDVVGRLCGLDLADCGGGGHRRPRRANLRIADGSPATVAAPTIAERTMWTVLAAIPAGLVVAVTDCDLDRLGGSAIPLGSAIVALSSDLCGDLPRSCRGWRTERVLSLVPFAAVALIATASRR